LTYPGCRVIVAVIVLFLALFSEGTRTAIFVACESLFGGVLVPTPAFGVEHVHFPFRAVDAVGVSLRSQPGTNAWPDRRRLDLSRVLLHQHVSTLEDFVRLVLENVVGPATDSVADKAADVGPWLQLTLLLLRFERPRPTPPNAESRDVGALTHQRLERRHFEPRL